MRTVIQIRGEIMIDPPIPWDDVKDSEFIETAGRAYLHDLRLVVLDVPGHASEGTLLRRHAVFIVAADSWPSGRVVEELQKIVDEFGAGRTFTGRFDLTCPDHMTQSRVKVIEGKAVQFEPTITWPGDSK